MAKDGIDSTKQVQIQKSTLYGTKERWKLVRLTQQHDVDIQQMKESLTSIVDVIYLMAEYNTGLLQLQISEQLDFFRQVYYYHKCYSTTSPS
jgi:hypothetical protein